MESFTSINGIVRFKRLNVTLNPPISPLNEYGAIYSNAIWSLFKDLIEASPREKIAEIFHDRYSPCVGLLPQGLEQSRKYIWREFRKVWEDRAWRLIDIIERYYLPEISTICAACGEPDVLVLHHWYDSKGRMHNRYICHSCNMMLVPSNFYLTRKTDHYLPDWDEQVTYIAKHKKMR